MFQVILWVQAPGVRPVCQGRRDVFGLSGELEHAVAIPIPGKGGASTLHQSLHQDEVATGVLLGTKHRVDHGAGGAVYGQQQCELRALLIQPPVVAAVNLHQPPQPAEAASPAAPRPGFAQGLLYPAEFT